MTDALTINCLWRALGRSSVHVMGSFNLLAAVILAVVTASIVPTTMATELPRYIMYLTGYVNQCSESLYQSI